MGSIEIVDSPSTERRTARVRVGGSSDDLFVERIGGVLSPAAGADPFVLASLLLFMRHREPMHVSGPVTRRLLIGLDEWQRAWSLWRPGAYEPVTITADEIVDVHPTSDRAVAAFTGGVDSTFTVCRHTAGEVGHATARLESVLFVHGFDIPLDDVDGFTAAAERAGAFLDSRGVSPILLRTNLRDLDQDWRDSHGLAVASMMGLLAPEFGVGLIASTNDYTNLGHSGGSNPVTDRLLSTGMMDIRHDGAECTREQKVAYLAARPGTHEHLRFCWEGIQRDRNCGVCLKCVRTACLFFASGVAHPACFERLPSIDEIRSVVVPHPMAHIYLSLLIESARVGGHSEEPWFEALVEAVDRFDRAGASSGPDDGDGRGRDPAASSQELEQLRSELSALRATRTFRWTEPARRVYGTVRRSVSRVPRTRATTPAATRPSRRQRR